MPRPFRDKIRDPNYWLEQSAHAWIGWGAALIWTWATTPLGLDPLFVALGCVLIAATTGAVRELIQNVGDEDNDIADAVLDWFMTTLGGVLEAVSVLPWVLVGS